jgi:CDP-glucose 4,6-dehydratase
MTAPLRVYDRARVLVFGHTGFVGGWLALWLHQLGAKVHGFALPPEDDPNLFDSLDLGKRVAHKIADVRARDTVVDTLRSVRPDVVFHLAAQSRVRRSYRSPIETFETNVMGTAHVLEALRAAPGARACVVVTSDKCYENLEQEDGYRESDRLGGGDAYSASKACAELVVSCYRKAFLDRCDPRVLVASARAGNIIGGGDWAEDRIVPDCVRALTSNQTLRLRNPQAVRPWQHVLDAVFGYLLLGARLLEGRDDCAEAWNFGPEAGDPKTVETLVARFQRDWTDGPPAPVEIASDGPAETRQLRLDSSKARERLGWRPRLDFDEAVAWTARWYRGFYRDSSTAREATNAQIALFEERL